MDRIEIGGNESNAIDSHGWYQSEIENVENTLEDVSESRNRNPDTDTVLTRTVGHSRPNRPKQTRVPRSGLGNEDTPPVSAIRNPGPPQKVA